MHLAIFVFRMVKVISLLFTISLFVFGCGQSISGRNRAYALQEGDLLFQDIDGGPLCNAIEKVTTGCHGANFTHVGIVAKDAADSFIVIEAMPDGVVTTELQSFLERSFDIENRPKVVVGQLKPPFRHLIPSAISNAFALKGKPYDKKFVINNDAYYCSELIYEIFLRANNNNPVFTLQPMTFKDPDTGVIFPAWQQYFSELAIPVPEGNPGINPGSISRSPTLNIVHAYGIPDGWEQAILNGMQ